MTHQNGGVIGAYHMWRPWGDTQLAGMFGTSAVAIGTGPARNVPRAMATEPERFNLARQLQGGADLDQTTDNCQARCQATTRITGLLGGSISMEDCLAACRGQKTGGCFVRLPGGYCLIPTTVGYALLGIGLVLIGVYAFTKA